MMQEQNVLFAFIRVHSWPIERLLRLIALALLMIPACPQNAPSPQNAELARAAQNPYDLARFVDSHAGLDWKALWKALGTEPLMIQPCGSLSNGTRQCSTELITVLNPDQVILLLQGDATPADVYLRFMQEKNGGWRFSGATWMEVRNHPRRHEIDRSTGRPFLRISGQGIRGLMVDSEYENWFDLTLPGFEPVFGFIVQGYQARFTNGIGRKISANISHGPKDEITGILSVSFLGRDEYGGEHHLGDTSYWVRYTRTPGAKAFTFQPDSSFGRGPKLSEAELKALTDLDQGPSNEDLVGYIMPQLGAIASGHDGAKKNWLKQFLSRAHDTPEVRELKALLK